MAQSQRVLSGSLTKGSNATPSGSIIYSYQGVNARTDASYFGSLLPRIGSGNRTKIYKSTKPLSDTEYDDSLTINDDTSDMGGEDDPRITTRISFDLERLAFGQPSTSQQGSMFADINRFDPVQYVNDPGEFMWPVNLWNLGQLPNHEFDGVVEVFDIRREVLGYMDLRYEGRTFRGSLTGPFSETPFGSTKITDKIQLVDFAPTPFFDGPNQMSHDRGTDIPVLARMSFMAHSASWTDPGSAMAFPGYQGLEIEKDAPVVAQDYHDIIYSSLRAHNPPKRQVARYNLNLTQSISGFTYKSGGSLLWWARGITNVSSDGFGQTTLPDSSMNSFTGSFKVSGNRPAHSARTPNVYLQSSTFIFDGTDDVIFVTGGYPGTGKQWNDLVGGDTDAGTLKPFSFAAWTYRPTTADTDVLFTIGGATTNPLYQGIKITITGVGRVTVRRGEDATAYVAVDTAAGVVAEDEWVHIAVTFSGIYDGITSGITMYVNGTEIAENNVNIGPGITSFGNNFLTLGDIANDAGVPQGTAWTGNLGDCALWDSVLTAEEIKAIYLAPSYPTVMSTSVGEGDMMQALKLLNSASCNGLTDPMDIRANHGFYFGQKAGSIVYGDW
jgi:hypothetical protein